MIVRVIHVFVKQDSVEAFEKATVENHHASLSEDGILRFDVLRDAADATHFMLYEVYRSQEAAESHKSTTHYSAWKNAVSDLMAKDRERFEYQVVAPASENGW